MCPEMTNIQHTINCLYKQQQLIHSLSLFKDSILVYARTIKHGQGIKKEKQKHIRDNHIEKQLFKRRHCSPSTAFCKAIVATINGFGNEIFVEIFQCVLQ